MTTIYLSIGSALLAFVGGFFLKLWLKSRKEAKEAKNRSDYLAKEHEATTREAADLKEKLKTEEEKVKLNGAVEKAESEIKERGNNATLSDIILARIRRSK